MPDLMSALLSIPKGRKFRSVVLLAAAFALFSPLGTSGDGVAAPLVAAETAPAPAEKPVENPLPKEGLVRMEVFTLPREDARTATRKFPKQADLYNWLGGELEKENPGVILERMMVLRVRGGQRSVLSEIEEYPHPTKFSPPRIPQSVGIVAPVSAPAATTPTTNSPPPVPPAPPASSELKGEPGPSGIPATTPPNPAAASSPGASNITWPYASAIPYRFQFKETGWTVEIELTMRDDGKKVDISIAAEFTRLCRLENQYPNSESVQQILETSRIAATIETTLGQPTLAGTFSPPGGTGVTGGNREGVTRLLFLTVTEPR